MANPKRIADLERELRSLRAAVQSLLTELERITEIEDDAQAGRELKRARRSQPLFAVPRPPRK
jgi:hypothetical protein